MSECIPTGSCQASAMASLATSRLCYLQVVGRVAPKCSSRTSPVSGPSQRHDLHGDFHPIPGVRRPFPGTGERGGLVLLTGDSNGDMLGAGEFVVRGIVAPPARAGNVDLGPGVGGTVLARAHLDVAGDKSRSKTPMPGSLHHEHGIVAARSGAQSERLAGKLDSGIMAGVVSESFVDAGVQLVQELGGVDEPAGAVKVQEPSLQGRAVVRITWETIWNDFHLLGRGVLEGIGLSERVDDAIDGRIIVKVDVHLTEETQFSRGLGKRDERDGIPVDVANPAHAGFGLDLES